MSMTLAPQLETRIQSELTRGNYREPSDLIAHALDLVDAENGIKTRRAEIIAEIKQSIEQVDRGEVVTEAQMRERMKQIRMSRAAAA